MLDILQEFLGTGAGGLGLKHLRLDGSTPVVERQARIRTPTSASPLHLAYISPTSRLYLP